jgi:hypothetical protein
VWQRVAAAGNDESGEGIAVVKVSVWKWFFCVFFPPDRHARTRRADAEVRSAANVKSKLRGRPFLFQDGVRLARR